MFEAEQRTVEQNIHAFCRKEGLPEINFQWTWIPFSGQWGICTSFFQLASQEAKLKAVLNKEGKRIPVPERAQEIASGVAEYLGLPEGFSRVEPIKGYLNLFFDTAEYTRRVVDNVNDLGKDFGRGAPKGERVMVEFSQPNTHKSFHVGHLRNVILGSATSNILEFAGFDLIRANYIGDIGLHVIKWMWNYRKYHNGEQPGDEKMRWMGDLYSEADRRFETEPEANPEVRALFARWDQHDPELVDLWHKTRQWSLEGFEQVYQMLGVHFDRIYFESEMEEPGKKLVVDLIQRGIASDERPENPVLIRLDELLGSKDEKYRVLVILRSDGTSLYSTKDLPLAIQKVEEYHLDRSIYVIDVRQSLYMQQIFKTLELMGYSWAKNLIHLAYEIVNLPGNVTMSSRDGTIVMLDDLIKEATVRTLQIVEEKNPELPADRKQAIARAVALGAIKYSMLSRDNTRIVTFDWETALDFNGQAAPYIQYAYVRAGSILRKAKDQNLDGGALGKSITPEFALSTAEISMIDLISHFPQEVQRSAKEYRPLYIASLAYDLAHAFNDFYNQCPVLTADPSVRMFRLRLVAASRQAIQNTLALIGIIAPEAM
jgi:arginyl-tRNA synthetase